MTSTILQNPYTAILSAIWSAFWGIIKISQGTANTLADRLRITLSNLNRQHDNTIPSSETANSLRWLYPEEWGCGVSKRKPPKTAKEQTYWQAVRLLVLRRDNNQCQNCGALSNLCVHHLSYTHQGNELEHLEDLTTLCRSCHARVHEGWRPDKSKLLPKCRFDPDSTWRLENWGGGTHGTLDECIEELFEYGPRINRLATTKQVRNRCLEVGYVSINGWVLCYVTDDGESTLDVEVE